MLWSWEELNLEHKTQSGQQKIAVSLASLLSWFSLAHVFLFSFPVSSPIFFNSFPFQSPPLCFLFSFAVSSFSRLESSLAVRSSAKRASVLLFCIPAVSPSFLRLQHSVVAFLLAFDTRYPRARPDDPFVFCNSIFKVDDAAAANGLSLSNEHFAFTNDTASP